MPLFSCLLKPHYRFGEVRRDAQALEVAKSKLKLCISFAVLCGLA